MFDIATYRPPSGSVSPSDSWRASPSGRSAAACGGAPAARP